MRTPFSTPRAISGLLRTTTLAAVSVFALTSCDKLDDYLGNSPGNGSANSNARLYVSNASDINTLTLYNVTASSKLDMAKVIQTDAKDGNGVAVSSNNTLMQVGRTDKVIKLFKNASSLSPAPTASSMFTDPAMTSGREIAYDEQRQMLYVANNVDSTLLVYSNPLSLNGTVSATKTLKLKGQPWGIHYDKDTNRLFVLLDLDARTVEIYNNPSNLKSGMIQAECSFKIEGSTRLHGITYSSKADVLVVTEIAAAMGDGATTDGGIYIFENAKNTVKGKGVTLTPTRTIKGMNTMLGNPVDVAFDDRKGKNEIYIAEKANKKILVFGLKDRGDVAPKSMVATTEGAEAIFLDIR